MAAERNGPRPPCGPRMGSRLGREATAGETGPSSGAGLFLAGHAAKDLLDLGAGEATMAAQGDQAGKQAVVRPTTDCLGRDVQDPSHLARGEVFDLLGFGHNGLQFLERLPEAPSARWEDVFSL